MPLADVDTRSKRPDRNAAFNQDTARRLASEAFIYSQLPSLADTAIVTWQGAAKGIYSALTGIDTNPSRTTVLQQIAEKMALPRLETTVVVNQLRGLLNLMDGKIGRNMPTDQAVGEVLKSKRSLSVLQFNDVVYLLTMYGEQRSGRLQTK